MAKESTVEKYLVKRWVESTGGMCIKFPPLFFAGFPDRVCLRAPAVCIFVETKAEGKGPRKLQDKVHTALRRLGFEVHVLDTNEKVDDFICTQ